MCVLEKFLLKGVCDKSSSNDEMLCGVYRCFTFPGDIFVCVYDFNLVQSGWIVSKHSFFASIMLARRFEEI